LSSFKGNTKTF